MLGLQVPTKILYKGKAPSHEGAGQGVPPRLRRGRSEVIRTPGILLPNGGLRLQIAVSGPFCP